MTTMPANMDRNYLQRWAEHRATRHITFWVLALVAAGLFVRTYWPRTTPVRPAGAQAAVRRAQEPEFRQVVAKVDQVFADQWQRAALVPAVPAAPLTVARRLSLGLHGTVPSLEEIRQLELLSVETQLDWWIDHLLADRRFADYMAERTARTLVSTVGGPFVLYRRRRFVTWLGDHLHDNRPYDELVREVITGSGIWTQSPEANFFTATIKPDTDGAQPNPALLTSRTARAFLGVRMDCAECHDHPFDQWKQADFQGLAAFFGQTRISATGIMDSEEPYKIQDRDTLEDVVVAPRVPFLPECLPEAGRPRERLAAWLTHKQNRAFARVTVNRTWNYLFGKPLVNPVDDIPLMGVVADGAASADSTNAAAQTPDAALNAHTANEPTDWSTSTNVPPALEILAEDFAAHGYDLKRLIRLIAATRVFRQESAVSPGPTGPQDAEVLEEHWAVFPVTRLRAEQVAGGLLQATRFSTMDTQESLFQRLDFYDKQKNFVDRYGDSGEAELQEQPVTIPQSLLLMNGDLTYERTASDGLSSSSRLAWLTGSDEKAVEMAFLVALTRRPTQAEKDAFVPMFAGKKGQDRADVMEDLYWCMLNGTEFSWNH